MLLATLSSDATSSHLKSSKSLENQAPGAGNEIQLTDAIDTLNKTQRVFAQSSKARYDVETSLA